jgi:uncharacterized protein YndB with AHSA1/START domain
MENTFHVQIKLKSTPESIFRALTHSTALTGWFAEFAAVSLDEKCYDFWGRFTPEAPARDAGHHPILEYEAGKHLKFKWNLSKTDTVAQVQIETRDQRTLLIVKHDAVLSNTDFSRYSVEDFWFLSLENLRRHLDGKAPVRCDFSASMKGDVRHTVEIEGSAQAVFDALIKPEQLQRWIASNATVEAEVGGRYEIGWEQSGPSKILELVPNQKLSTLWPGEQDTVLTWTLEESGGKTRLTIVHSGFAPDQDTGGLQVGWLNFMSWVRSLVEYGADWHPPTVKIPEGFKWLYPASINAAQNEI